MRISHGDPAAHSATHAEMAELRARQATAAKTAAAAAAYRGDVAKVSTEARGLSSTMTTFNVAKVEQLRSAMASNRIEAHPRAIAARLAEEA